MAFMDNPKKEAKFLRKISQDITYPLKGELGKPINYIEVLDQKKDGTGGCVYLKNGGVGQKTVTLHIKSQRNKGYSFVIRIYSQY